MNDAPLAGRTILVTRPLAQARELGDAIAARGGQPHYFPLLEIGPAPDPAPLARAAEHLADYDLAVFISPNAVAYALPVLLAAEPWPAGLRPAAVGPGTVRALAEHGVGECLVPSDRFDSEALLALPELAPERMQGRRVALFRGNGGRELLADTLTARGARVDCIACYQRSAPSQSGAELADCLARGGLDGLTVSSSEALAYLVELPGLAGDARLLQLPLFVPHARIAARAEQLGFARVQLTGPADAGILAGLCAYNWPQP